MNNEMIDATTKKPRRKLLTLKQKMAIVKEMDTSGLSTKDLAQYYGVIPNTLRVWHRRFSKNRAPQNTKISTMTKQIKDKNASEVIKFAEPELVTPTPESAPKLEQKQDNQTAQMIIKVENLEQRVQFLIDNENKYAVEIERLHIENNRLRVALNALLSN